MAGLAARTARSARFREGMLPRSQAISPFWVPGVSELGMIPVSVVSVGVVPWVAGGVRMSWDACRTTALSAEAWRQLGETRPAWRGPTCADVHALAPGGAGAVEGRAG